MDLKVTDVAKLLNTSQEHVEKLIVEGKLPAYRLDKEYRFNRYEIEDWVLHDKINLALFPKNDLHMQFCLYKALYRGDVLTHPGNTSKENVIKDILKQFAKKHDLDADVLSDLFLDRERLMPTSLEKGIAIPHTRDFLLETHFDIVVTICLDHSIEYGALDRQPVHTLFFIFACDDRNHLNLVSKIAYLCSNQLNRDFLQAAPKRLKLLEYVRVWESGLKP